MTLKILPASGPYTGNGADAVPSAAPAFLADGNDATFVESSATGPLGYTVGLEPLVGYEAGDPISLHIRMEMTGGGTPPIGHGEVFIATDAPGMDEIAGFSDGTTSGFGFAIPGILDGTTLDLVVPLSLTAWGGSGTLPTVVAALEAGAYLDFNAFINENYDTPSPIAVVYEAAVWVGSELTAPSPLRIYPRSSTRIYPRRRTRRPGTF